MAFMRLKMRNVGSKGEERKPILPEMSLPIFYSSGLYIDFGRRRERIYPRSMTVDFLKLEK